MMTVIYLLMAFIAIRILLIPSPRPQPIICNTHVWSYDENEQLRCKCCGKLPG